MTISNRGPRNILVLDRTGVQIIDVCDAIAEYKDITWVTQRYPITVDEIFECIDAFIDLAKPSKKDKLELDFADDPNSTDVDLDVQATAITDRIYFLIISYAKSILHDCETIDDLFRYGLELIIVDCLEDVEKGERGFENSEVHSIVFNALTKMHKKHDREIDYTNFKMSPDLERLLKYVKPQVQ
jgi:hypothetical protein